MMTDERISSYIRSLDRPRPEILEKIRQEALQAGVPIIRPETESFLIFLTELTKPMSILEVGCAVGYSALMMSAHQPEGGRITTIENYEPRIPVAKENFRRASREDRITLLEGDAGEILKKLSGSYDLIFMDAAKAQYINWLPDVLRLLSPDGVLVSDNVLQDGDVVESRYAVTRRDRTIHSRMRAYLERLKSDPVLSSAVLPVGDGVAVTTKNSRVVPGTGADAMHGTAMPDDTQAGSTADDMQAGCTADDTQAGSTADDMQAGCTADDTQAGSTADDTGESDEES